MARTISNTTLETAKIRRRRFVTFPISSADISSPRPDPGPTRPPEKSPDRRERQGDDDEPGHHPPWQRPRPQIFLESRVAGGIEIRNEAERSHQSGGNQHGPCVIEGEQYKEEREDSYVNLQPSGAAVRPKRLAFDVHVKVRDDDERQNHQRGEQNSGDERRKVMEQLLKTQKIPRRLGGIRGEQRIGKLLERRIPEK